MILLIDLFSALILLIIAIQDLRHRKISWILIPLLLIGFGSKAILSQGFHEAGILFLKNLGFLAIQFLALFVFYLLKERKAVNLVNHKIGVGDVLFFIAICPAFSLLNFLFFYLSGIILTLTGYLLFRLLSKNSSAEVPLAGCLSFILMLFIIFQYLTFHFDPYNDGMIISFLTSWKQ